MTAFGTADGVAVQQQTGGLPTRNWTSGVFEDWKQPDRRDA